MPWNSALSEDERAQLLALIRKMLAAAPIPAPAGDATGSGAASDDPIQGQLASLLVGALQEHVNQVSPDVPPASAGGGE
jgi:hypothetical protein